MIFYYQRFIIFFILALLCEYLKFIRSQPTSDSLFNLVFDFFLMIYSGKFLNAVCFILFVWIIFETVCYFITRKGFNVQILMAFDVKWIIKNELKQVVLVALAVSAFCIVVFSKWGLRYTYIPNTYLKINSLALVSMSYVFMRRIYSNLFPFQIKYFPDVNTYAIKEFFMQNIQSVSTVQHPKNLLLVEMESIENQLYEPIYYEGGMPFLLNITKTGAVFTNLIPQPYTVWSVASTFTVHCNMPLIMPTGEDNNKQVFHLISDHKCIGDYLHKAGYKLYSYMTNFFVGYFAEMLSLHHWTTYDINNHTFKKDWDVFDLIIDEVLPNLTKQNEPFALHIANTDTHAFESVVDPRCTPRNNNTCQTQRCLDCFDQLLARFFRRFEKRFNVDDFVVILYGDHPIMINYMTINKLNCIKIKEPRLLTAFFPYMPHNVSHKNASLYDLTPTILELLNISYSPKFPHGVNLFSDQIGRVPDDDTYNFVFTYFSKTMRDKWKDKEFDPKEWIRVGQDLVKKPPKKKRK